MKANQRGFTLLELMVVVAIIGILYTLAMPRYVLMNQKAHQAKTRGNLASLRSALQLYYTDQEGKWPLADVFVGVAPPNGVGGESLISVLHPRYISAVPAPFLMDFNPTYNGLSVSYDNAAAQAMSLNPPHDVFILHGEAQPTSANYPMGYNNQTGEIFINSYNYDTAGNFFYTW